MKQNTRNRYDTDYKLDDNNFEQNFLYLWGKNGKEVIGRERGNRYLRLDCELSTDSSVCVGERVRAAGRLRRLRRCDFTGAFGVLKLYSFY